VVNRDFFNKKFQIVILKNLANFPPRKKKEKESRIYTLEKQNFPKLSPNFWSMKRQNKFVGKTNKFYKKSHDRFGQSFRNVFLMTRCPSDGSKMLKSETGTLAVEKETKKTERERERERRRRSLGFCASSKFSLLSLLSCAIAAILTTVFGSSFIVKSSG
jgi:hypothetical protein